MPPVFIAPLPREQLFDPGSVFPARELTHRVLSMFWRDCCCLPYFSRAPAPVIQLAGDEITGAAAEAAPRALRAWWLMDDGIVEEGEGPHSERFRPFLGWTGATSASTGKERLWPRYEFRIFSQPFEVEMCFHRDAQVVHGHRTRLLAQPDGCVRVIEREPWWVR